MPKHHNAPSAHKLTSDSTQNHKVVQASGERARVSGLNLPIHQAVALPSGQSFEEMIVVNSSPFAWGNLGTLDIKGAGSGAVLDSIVLQFNLSAVGGTTIVGSFAPSHFFFDHIDVAIGGTVVETIYGNSNFLLTQALNFDESRRALNNMAGAYDIAANRTALSSTTTNNVFYCKLFANVFKGLHLLSNSSDIQLRIYMNPLTTAFALTSGTGLSNTINQVSAYCSVVRLGSEGANHELMSLKSEPHHRIYHKLTWNSYTVLAGTTTTNIVLTGLSGKIAGFFFTIRSSTVAPNNWVYLPLSQWALLDGNSTNICGGLPLPATFSHNYLNSINSKGSYCTETTYGSNNQNAFYYSFSHSADFVDALTHGKALGSRAYKGTEQLQLTFPTSTITAYTLDVYAFVETIAQHSDFDFKNIGM